MPQVSHCMAPIIQRTPLVDESGLIPTYNLAWGLRTVDGSYNHLLPGQEKWGAAGNQFPELVDATFDPAENIPPGFGPPGPAIPTSYNPSNNPGSMVFNSMPRTISNLLVDQTLGNPAAILTALDRAGSANSLLICLQSGNLCGVQAGIRRRIPGQGRYAGGRGGRSTTTPSTRR